LPALHLPLWARQIVWFGFLWLCGVAVLATVGGLIKLVI